MKIGIHSVIEKTLIMFAIRIGIFLKFLSKKLLLIDLWIYGSKGNEIWYTQCASEDLACVCYMTESCSVIP